MILESWLLETPAIVALLNVATVVTLVCWIGMFAAKRGRSTALRHAILLASLLLVLSVPWMTSVARTGQLGWLTFDMSDAPWRGRIADHHSLAPVHGVDVEARTAAEGPQILGHNSIEALASGAIFHPNASTVGDAGIAGSQSLPGGAAVGNPAIEFSTIVRVWQWSFTLAALVWFLGSIVAVARLGRGYLVVIRLRRSLRFASAPIQCVAQTAADRMGMRSGTKIFESSLAPTPLVMGLWRPIVVLPAGIDQRVSSHQLEAMLVHELAHVSRKDPWFGVLQCVAAVLYWWHPVVRRLNSQLSSVREDLCDNYVIRQQGSSFAYAQALVEMAAHVTRSRSLPVTVGLFEESDGLEQRIVRLLDSHQNRETQLSRVSVAIVAAFAFLVTTLTIGTSVQVVSAGPLESEHASTAISNETHVRNREELLRAARAAQPGTTILLEPGTYRGGISIDRLRGTAEHPIVIAAADPHDRPIIEGGTTCIQLTDPAYVELRDLVFQGARVNGLNIDDGRSHDTPAHHIVLRSLVARDNGSDGNHDGFKLSGVDDFLIENCEVQRWGKKGSGIDMVGCHRGLVVDCNFREGDQVYGSGVQMKGGSRDITVRFCRFESAGGRAVNLGGSTGMAYFRPRPQGYEAKDITVEDCTFIGSSSPIAFVGVDGAVVQYNTIYRPKRYVMRILQETQAEEFVPARNGHFNHNVVVFRSDEVASAVNVGSKTAPRTFQFSNNYWFCDDRPGKTKRIVQLPTAEINGTYGVSPKFVDAESGNLTLHRNSPIRHAGPRVNRNLHSENSRDTDSGTRLHSKTVPDRKPKKTGVRVH